MLPSHTARLKDVSSPSTSNEIETTETVTNEVESVKKTKDKDPKFVLFAVVGYMTCSSLMLIGNKVAVVNIPAPAFILFAQMFSCALFCLLLGITGIVNLDKLEWGKVKPFIPVVFVFLGTIYANIKTLQYCNVETFIVFRASTPLAVSIGDWLFLGRELPSLKSWMCLIGILFGAVIYMQNDKGWTLTGYSWVCIWYLIFISDQLYIKHVCEKVKVNSNWGRVYYTNLMASLPLAIFVIYNQEIALIEWNISTILSLLLTCVLGIAMSYFAYLARHLVSAAYFTVIGNVCKVLTVLINYFIWELHADMYGIGSLLLCLLFAYFYKQAPKRQDTSQKSDTV